MSDFYNPAQHDGSSTFVVASLLALGAAAIVLTGIFCAHPHGSQCAEVRYEQITDTATHWIGRTADYYRADGTHIFPPANALVLRRIVECPHPEGRGP